MKTINAPEQLLLTFAGLLEKPEFEDFALRISAPAGKKPELRIEAQNQKVHLPIHLDLHPSRKVLDRPAEVKAKPFLLLAPHIPDELAKDFRRQGLNHADLNGRLFLKTAYLLLDREPRGREYRGPVVDADWFSLKSSRLIRALLSHPGRAWQQGELAARTGTSPGLVSRIVSALLREGFLSKEPWSKTWKPAEYTLREGDRLLELWKAADVWVKRVHVQQYSVLRGDLDDIAKAVQDGLGEENLAFTQWFAANLRFPYTTPPVVSAYVSRERLPEIRFARKVTAGGNLWLLVPEDEGVFIETQTVKGFRLVSDIQIYLDLLQVGQRGPEQAEALRSWEGFNQ